LTATQAETSISFIATSTVSATASITASATITNTPIQLTIGASATNISMPTQQLQARDTATPLPSVFIFGQSAGGRELKAFRYGTGANIFMLVGGIHAGFEANTVELMEEFQEYFENNPTRINPNVTFLIIPSLNPDGLSRGRILEGRFNNNRVDLNRNWACGWSEDAVFKNGAVNPGENAFSEPETTALGSLIQRLKPRTVLFYHAAADGVFAGACEGHETESLELAALYGETSGYPYGEAFSAYPVTGTAPAWLASMGISALDVELATAIGIEFERNLRAVLAVQEWIQQP
jgi:zinc carboxypeptidase